MRSPLFLLFVLRRELISPTEVEDMKGSFGCYPHPQTFPQASTLAALSTPQALLSLSIYPSPDLLWLSSS